MLEGFDLSAKLNKKEYKAQAGPLKKELAQLQQALKEKQIPVVIAIEGFSAAGKGTLIGRIVQPLDPRYFKVYTMGKIAEDELRRPFLWSYWTKLPANGEIAIFDKSWSRSVLPGIAPKWKLKSAERSEFYNDVNVFERQLVDSGMLVVKLFLHISRAEQYRRLKELEKNPATAWRVNEHDFEQNRDYDGHAKRFDKLLQNTEAESRWHIIAAEDRRYATVNAYRIIIDEIKEALARHGNTQAVLEPTEQVTPILSATNPNRDISDDDYRERLAYYQSRISELGFSLYSKQRAVAIVYEGWDAAGKGGNIKRLTEELDPRGYEVVPIAAPNRDELAHHYLWRFYQKLPKDGHIAIFDRSWYGRVMVERVEGYAKPEEVRRAYREINEMERHWTNHGMVILKFWLHIDKDEQLRRFRSRTEDPSKQYKITDEDWRNRDKWEQYEEAVNEMLFRTHTDYAHWEIVPANNKRFARLHVLERVIDELEKRLDNGKD